MKSTFPGILPEGVKLIMVSIFFPILALVAVSQER
jgi:hypothetical protein